MGTAQGPARPESRYPAAGTGGSSLGEAGQEPGVDTPILGARPSALSSGIPYTAVTTEPLKYGQRDWGTEFLIDFLLVTLHVN